MNNNNKGMAWCIGIGLGLVILGAMFGGGDKTPSTTTNTVHTKPVQSAWCIRHSTDQVDFNDPTDVANLHRYMSECEGVS